MRDLKLRSSQDTPGWIYLDDYFWRIPSHDLFKRFPEEDCPLFKKHKAIFSFCTTGRIVPEQDIPPFVKAAYLYTWM